MLAGRRPVRRREVGQGDGFGARPEAQAYVADELGTGDPSAIVFAANTHDLLVRLVGGPRRDPARLRVLTSDGEFHSARRQFARWAEEGWLELETVAAEPFGDFTRRFLSAARSGNHDLILVSHVLFEAGACSKA